MKIIEGGFCLRQPIVAEAAALEQFQRKIFPSLSEAEIITAAHFQRFIELFPEGQVVILDGEKIIGSASAFRCAFPALQHTFLEITGNLWLTTHDPAGDWLYGIDVAVDPEYRGIGLARVLFRALHETCRMLKMKGQVIVGMPNGYGALKDIVPFEDYFEKVVTGGIFDPTLSKQIKIGFEPVGIIPEYLNDPKCGNYGVLMRLPVDKIV